MDLSASLEFLIIVYITANEVSTQFQPNYILFRVCQKCLKDITGNFRVILKALTRQKSYND